MDFLPRDKETREVEDIRHKTGNRTGDRQANEKREGNAVSQKFDNNLHSKIPAAIEKEQSNINSKPVPFSLSLELTKLGG